MELYGPFKRTLRIILGWLAAFIIFFSPSAKKAKHKTLHSNSILPILFHQPSRKLFNSIIIWLKNKGYTFLSSSQLIEILDKKMPFPKGAVWISLDDGWRSNLDNVIPIAVKHNIPITIFANTDAIEKGAYWWRKVRQFPQALPAQYQDVATIRKLPEKTRKQVLESMDQSGVKYPREAMAVEELKKIANIPQVTIGAHTVSHPLLTSCNDEEIDFEITESKRKIEEWTGKTVNIFAYPNGAYSGREKSVLQTRGFKLAVTTKSGFISPETDTYLVPRNEIAEMASILENLCHVLGIWQKFVTKIKD